MIHIPRYVSGFVIRIDNKILQSIFPRATASVVKRAPLKMVDDIFSSYYLARKCFLCVNQTSPARFLSGVISIFLGWIRISEPCSTLGATLPITPDDPGPGEFITRVFVCYLEFKPRGFLLIKQYFSFERNEENISSYGWSFIIEELLCFKDFIFSCHQHILGTFVFRAKIWNFSDTHKWRYSIFNFVP